MVKKKQKRGKKNTPIPMVIKHHEPEYMVQISEPTALRKDVLESLREIIIFMQGYERFRKIQEEKVLAITALRTQIRQLHQLLEMQMRKYLPPGKLHAVLPQKAKEETETHQGEDTDGPDDQPLLRKASVAAEPPLPPTDLEELESELRNIEGQLKGM